MVRKRSLPFVVVVASLALLLAMQAASVSARDPKILEFDTMVGVPTALTGTQGPIRGVNGAGAPWMLTAATGELSTGGHLEIQVDGLVLAAGANAGSNPVNAFRGIVSCLAADGTIQNVQTATFPATTGPATAGGGDAKIEATLSLPHPCIAPIVFVTNANGAWFASTGG